MTEPLQRLIRLLEDLLQLDLADLDFGVYRLFRLRQAEIQAFLQDQLPRAVEEAFAEVTAADRAQLERTLEERARQVRELIAPDAILPTGEANPRYHGIKALDEYDAARRALTATDAVEHLRTEVFNWLYSFFARYYDDGDFIPRRFFGARLTYAVPDQGEEVLLYWANQGQYYVKNGDTFRDYVFSLETTGGTYSVRFRLVEATVPKDDVKGQTRLFFALPEDLVFDPLTRTLTVPFEYRVPTPDETER
jgi:adenine-specific DNA-methyltransferase